MLKIEIQRVQQQWIAEAIYEGISMWNPKFNADDDGDRISNLPESVLCHIHPFFKPRIPYEPVF